MSQNEPCDKYVKHMTNGLINFRWPMRRNIVLSNNMICFPTYIKEKKTSSLVINVFYFNLWRLSLYLKSTPCFHAFPLSLHVCSNLFYFAKHWMQEFDHSLYITLKIISSNFYSHIYSFTFVGEYRYKWYKVSKIWNKNSRWYIFSNSGANRWIRKTKTWPWTFDVEVQKIYWNH